MRKGYTSRETAVRNLMAGRQKADQAPNARHGVNSFLYSGRVLKKVRPTVEAVEVWRDMVLSEEGLLNAPPGESVKRRALVDSAARSMTVIALVYRDILKRGVMVTMPNQEELVPNPLLNTMARFEKLLGQTLGDLGLDRKARAITPAEYLQSIVEPPVEAADPDGSLAVTECPNEADLSEPTPNHGSKENA